MARVIEDIPVVEKRIVHINGCGRTIAYVPNEVREIHRTDYGGGPDGKEFIICPSCGKEITVRAW